MNRLSWVVIGILLVFGFLVSTHLNVRYPVGTTAGMDKLTLTTASEGGNFTLPAGTTVVVYDADGKKLDPQPPLTVNPTMGSATSSCTIELPDGYNFPAGGFVMVSQISTSNNDGPPSGVMTNEHP